MPPWKRQQRGDVDDGTCCVAPASAALAERLAGEEHGLQVDIHAHRPSRLSLKSTASVAPDDAGVVDQDVDPIFLANSITRRHRIGEVQRKQFAALGDLARRVSSQSRRAAQRTSAPARPHGDRDRLADARIGTGDQGASCPQAKIGSPQVSHRNHVHVGEVDVVAGHRPAEGIGAGAGAAMDQTTAARSPPPRWTSRQVTGFLGLDP
jgi:hypothetical protein